MRTPSGRQELRGYGQDCPVARTLDLLGDRWTLLIVRDLLLGTARFNEFFVRSPGMPSRILSDRLKRLEASGIVERRVYSEHPLRAEYALTLLGESLRPVVVAIAAWGMEHTLNRRERTRVAARLEAHGITFG